MMMMMMMVRVCVVIMLMMIDDNSYGLKTWKYIVTIQGREVTSTGKLADGPGNA